MDTPNPGYVTENKRICIYKNFEKEASPQKIYHAHLHLVRMVKITSKLLEV